MGYTLLHRITIANEGILSRNALHTFLLVLATYQRLHPLAAGVWEMILAQNQDLPTNNWSEARRFMDHLFELARGRGFQHISLTVNRRNIKAINFYFKAGYVIRSAVDLAIGRGFTLNDFIMARRLS